MSNDVRDGAPRWLQLSIQALILYSVVTLCLETMPELIAYREFFEISEFIVVVIFTVEYFACWTFSNNRWTYPFRLMSIVDLLAILPFYLNAGLDLRSLRSLRLMRIFRVLKLGRYSTALQTLGDSLKRSWPELSAVLFLTLIIALISAMGLYYAEHDAQPKVFSSIPASLWWAIVTLTTVGYGDAYPITPLGKLMAGTIMILGIGLIAVPTGIVSSNLTEMMRESRGSESD
jgi:voltage-gated potassium channel